MGFNPFEAYKSIIRGALVGSARDPMSSIRSTIDIFVPLCVTALGLSCAFKMKFWNIGGEGQIIMGRFSLHSLPLITLRFRDP